MLLHAISSRRLTMRAGILLLATSPHVVLAQANEPSPQPAAEYVIRAFDRYPLVALSEWHGARETMDFVARLIRQPGFAGQVADIVVEFGNARYQAVMDRYTAGQDVAREELSRVWENTTQVSGVWSSPIYEAFLADIRAFNQAVPVPKRIRVLLGDPPIDWATVTSPADEDMNDWRDAHFAWVVEHRVIRKGHKALLFVGGAHISRKVILPNSLIHLLDARLPGKTLVVSALQLPLLSPRVAARLRSWPVPSVAEVRNTWLGSVDVRDVGFGLSRGRLQDDIDAVLVLSQEAFSSVPARVPPESTTPESRAALEAVVAELQRDRNLRLLVKAYADATEVDAQRLSKARAEAIAGWLERHGIDRRRLATLGCGSGRPAWESDTEQHRAANRRAELVRQSARAGCQPPASFDWR